MPITSDTVVHQLTRRGYLIVRRTADHSLFEQDGDRVVIPHQPTGLTPWAVRAIEWSLEPRLGRQWLSAPTSEPPARAARGRRTGPPGRHLTLAIQRAPGEAMWNAFVIEEPRILTCGPTLAETRRRAADAAGVWFCDHGQVRLEPCLQLDEATRAWLDHATTPVRTPERVAEARRHLELLGLAAEDVTELLGPPRSADRDDVS